MNDGLPQPGAASDAAVSAGFFATRWRGAAPLQLLLWRDMLGVATCINLLASLLALILASRGLDMRLAVLLHFAPLPYNLFLWLALWRSPRRTLLSGSIAAAWFVVMLIL